MRTTPRATKRRCARATSCWPRTAGTTGLARRARSRRWPSMARRSPRRARGPSPRSTSGSADAPDDEFARAAIALEGWDGGDLAATLRANRARDAAAGRATEGPHRQDLAVTHRAKQMPAARSLDRRAEGAAARPGPRPCRAGRRAPRRAADPAARRGRRASRSQAPRGAVRPARRARPGVDDRDRSGAVRRHRRRPARFHVEAGTIHPERMTGLS